MNLVFNIKFKLKKCNNQHNKELHLNSNAFD